jgi:cytochrome c oxidase subunit 3
MSEGTKHKEPEIYDEYQNFTFHPNNVLLFLTLFGLTALFLSMSVAFVYSRIQNGQPALRLPNIFFFNTLILLGSSATMLWAKRAYLQDNTRNYQLALMATMLLSIVFMVAQYIGWRTLFSQNILITSSNSAGYLYIISILHFAHVIAGLPFLGTFLWRARTEMKEPVTVLVYFSDPEKRLRLRLLTIYWHFLDGLWIYLVLFFWINYLIQ